MEQTQAEAATTIRDATASILDVIEEQRDKETPTATSLAKPTPEDFNLPPNMEEWSGVVNRMMDLGLTSKEANASLDKRKRQYNTALREFLNSNGKPLARKGRPKSRKNSINDAQH